MDLSLPETSSTGTDKLRSMLGETGVALRVGDETGETSGITNGSLRSLDNSKNWVGRVWKVDLKDIL